MGITNLKKSEKIFLLAFTILFISLSVILIHDLIFEDFNILTFIVFIISAIASIFLSIIILIAFSSKTILQENGVAYKTIFNNRFHSWDEVNFVAEYKITPRYTQVNGIICSIDLEKDEIKYSDFTTVISKKHFLCFPYSEEAKDFLISNLPYGKYLGLAFTDETFRKK